MFFIELIQVALGARNKLSRTPSVYEWEQFFIEAQRQAISGVVFDGIEKLPQEQRPEKVIALKWISVSELLRRRNIKLNKLCLELQHLFASAGFRSCILKGQGNTRMYPNPYARTPGDIDIWIEGERNAIKKFIYDITGDAHEGYKDVAFQYKDVEVEAHFFPAYINDYFKNKKLQYYFNKKKDRQFSNYALIEDGIQLCVPTDDFNVVYQMCHLFHHFFCEGIGLRHFVDYYYLLKRIDNKDLNYHIHLSNVKESFDVFGLSRFASGVMWIEKNILGISSEYLLIKEDEKLGKLILKEIMEYGNFNKSNMVGKSLIAMKLSNTFRPFKYIFQFPKASIDRILFLGRLQLKKLCLK